MIMWGIAALWLALSGLFWLLGLEVLSPYCFGAAIGTALGQAGVTLYRWRTR